MMSAKNSSFPGGLLNTPSVLLDPPRWCCSQDMLKGLGQQGLVGGISGILDPLFTGFECCMYGIMMFILPSSIATHNKA